MVSTSSTRRTRRPATTTRGRRARSPGLVAARGVAAARPAGGWRGGGRACRGRPAGRRAGQRAGRARPTGCSGGAAAGAGAAAPGRRIGLGEQVAAGGGHPAGEGKGGVEPVAVLQRQHQPPAGAGVDERGGAAVPARRVAVAALADPSARPSRRSRRRSARRSGGRWRPRGSGCQLQQAAQSRPGVDVGAGQARQRGGKTTSSPAEAVVASFGIWSMGIGRWGPYVKGAGVSPMPTPALFDPDLLAPRRARAARIGGADFLQEAVADEIAERLQEVNRRFLAPAIVGPRAGLWGGATSGWPARRWRRTPSLPTSRRGRTISWCMRWRCTGRTIRWASSCSAAGRWHRTGCSSRRSTAARRSMSCAARWRRRRSRRRAASARGWRRWAKSATSGACCSGRGSRCRWPTAGAST